MWLYFVNVVLVVVAAPVEVAVAAVAVFALTEAQTLQKSCLRIVVMPIWGLCWYGIVLMQLLEVHLETKPSLPPWKLPG